MKKHLIYSGVFLTLTFTACNRAENPEDVEAPTIELEEPHNYDEFASGGEIHFEAHFEDDQELSMYEIEVHDNFDSHAHGRMKEPALPFFSYEQSFPLQGSHQEVHKEINVVMNNVSRFAAGPYDFIVKAVDKAGNSTSFEDESSKEVIILITNDEMPELVGFESNLHDGEIEVEPGHRLTLVGTLRDMNGGRAGQNRGLDEVEFTLREKKDDHGAGHSHRVKDFKMEDEVELDGAIEYDLSQWEGFQIPSDLADGDYILQIKAIDKDGNIMIKRFKVHVD
jgi:hypothetical protein